MWAPEPVRLENGLAMNVAIAPDRWASWPAIIRKNVKRSAVVEGVGISKVDLVLEIGVFMVGLVDAPAEPVEAVVRARAGNPERPRCP